MFKGCCFPCQPDKCNVDQKEKLHCQKESYHIMCIHNCYEGALGADEAYWLNAVFYQTHVLFTLGNSSPTAFVLHQSTLLYDVCLHVYEHICAQIQIRTCVRCVCMHKAKVDLKQLLQSICSPELLLNSGLSDSSQLGHHTHPASMC